MNGKGEPNRKPSPKQRLEQGVFSFLGRGFNFSEQEIQAQSEKKHGTRRGQCGAAVINEKKGKGGNRQGDHSCFPIKNLSAQ